MIRPGPEPPKILSQKSSSSLSYNESNFDEILPTPEQSKHHLITTEQLDVKRFKFAKK